MSTPTLAQLEQQSDRMIDAANQAHAAVEDLARAANGNAGHVIPGPTAYDLLGNLSSLLWQLDEVAEFLPTGLRNSLNDERITVVDRDFNTGEVRDAAAQIDLAAKHLAELHAALQTAAAAAGAAQVAINSQGWEPVAR